MSAETGSDHSKEQLTPTGAVDGSSQQKTVLAGRRAGQRAQLVDRTPRPVWAQEGWERAPSPHVSTQAQGSPALEWREPHPHGRLIRGWNGSANERTEDPVCPHGG